MSTPTQATDSQPHTEVPIPPNHRRVVTGHDENGKAVLSMDGPLESKVRLDNSTHLEEQMRGRIRTTIA
jgi:hypothetical protein